ncbi:MAG: TrmH family RNA methyltransferase [Alphaproteobacteria bacterium]
MTTTDKPLSKTSLREGKVGKEAYFSLPKLPLILILDNLKVAHNVGTILRVAEALMVSKVYLCGTTITPPNAKIKTASRGAERWIAWEYLPTTLEAVQRAKEQGYKVLSLEISDKSQLYTTYVYGSQPHAFVLGREYDGVAPEVLDASDAVVHLPMHGMANSINVACSASVLMYHYVSQQR